MYKIIVYLICQFSCKSFFIALVTQIFKCDILPNACSYLNDNISSFGLTYL